MAAGRVHVYCVDGTNLVRRARGYGGPGFFDQEDADADFLVAELSEACEQIGPRLEVELFFDGPSRTWPLRAANLRVRAAREEGADALILDRVRAKRHFGGGSVTVVTGDSDLGRRAVDEGAQWLELRPGMGAQSVARSLRARFMR